MIIDFLKVENFIEFIMNHQKIESREIPVFCESI